MKYVSENFTAVFKKSYPHAIIFATTSYLSIERTMESSLSFEPGTDLDHVTAEQFDFVSYLKDTNIKIGCLTENSDDGKPILK